MCAVGLAALIAVEERRTDAERQSDSDEERVGGERRKNELAGLARRGMALGDFLIVLHPLGHEARGGPPVDPIRGVDQFTAFGDLVGFQHAGNVAQHWRLRLLRSWVLLASQPAQRLPRTAS